MTPKKTPITLRRSGSIVLTAFALAFALAPSRAQADDASPPNGAQAPGPACGGPGAHGPLGLVHAALKEPIGLSAEQRAAVETSLASLRPSAREETAHASHRASLAAQIRAGAIDESALASSGPTTEERAAHEAAAASVVTTLHDTLSADQRSALVAAVMARHAGGPPADARGRHLGGPMRLFEGLGLSDAQESAVRAALDVGRPDEATMRARFEAMRVEEEARVRSFLGEGFEGRAFVRPPAGGGGGEGRGGFEGGPERMVRDLAVVVPLLTGAQRGVLAQRVEGGPPGGAGGDLRGRLVARSAPTREPCRRVVIARRILEYRCSAKHL